MTEFVDYLQGFTNGAIAIRLIIATFFGSIIGLERIAKGHNAGVRTFALVSLGAAAATILNVKLCDIPDMYADASRIPSQVVSGIGFLGAGSILVTGRNQIKGLTTAASLWVSAAMGMVIGAGFLCMGLVCFALILIANSLLQHVSQRVENHNAIINIYLEVEKAKGVVKLRKYISETNYNLVSMTKTKEKPLLSTDTGLNVVLNLGKKTEHQTVLNEMNNLEFVNYVEEV